MLYSLHAEVERMEFTDGSGTVWDAAQMDAKADTATEGWESVADPSARDLLHRG